MKQQSFSDIEYANRRRKTKREAFLDSMNEIIPWSHWIELIKPYYYNKKRGRRPIDIEIMLRMYLMQNWFNLSDEGMEEAIYDSYAMRSFLGINFIDEQVPDATTLLKFRHLLEKHHIGGVVTHMIPYHQMTLADVFTETQEIFESDKPRFLKLLESSIDLSELIPVSFRNHFYASTGRPSNGFDKSYDPYKAAYGSMPTHASADPEIKQQYLNGHFCYAYKAGVLTNGLGIIRAIEFYDKDYFASHPEIERYRKTNAPDEDKSVGDARLLLPLLKDFFRKHPLINPKIFLGDSAFDSIEIYKALLSGDTFGCYSDGRLRIFEKAYIPLRSGLKLTSPDYTINENGIPCCPHDPSLPMKPEGNTSHLRCGLKTFKFVCPKMKWETGADRKPHRVCHCEDPCTDSACGRMVYLYPEKDLRRCPGTVRGTAEWESTYKIRTSVERSINHIKDCFCLGDRKTQNAKTLHADLLLAGITQLITVVVADRIHKSEYFRSLKRLVA